MKDTALYQKSYKDLRRSHMHVLKCWIYNKLNVIIINLFLLFSFIYYFVLFFIYFVNVIGFNVYILQSGLSLDIYFVQINDLDSDFKDSVFTNTFNKDKAMI